MHTPDQTVCIHFVYFLHGKVASYTSFIPQRFLTLNPQCVPDIFTACGRAVPPRRCTPRTAECRLSWHVNLFKKKKKKKLSTTCLRAAPNNSKPIFFVLGRSRRAESQRPSRGKVDCSWRELPTCQLWLRRAQTWSGPGNADGGRERRFIFLRARTGLKWRSEPVCGRRVRAKLVFF